MSSILISSSKPDYVLKKARSLGDILLSETNFQELQEILYRPKFDKYVSLITRTEFMAKIKLECELINIIEKVKVCRNSKDDKFLEVAINGKANFLITGDQDLLILNPFKNIKIITVNEFLARFDGEKN